jgi:hypothetical protein
VRPIGAAAVQRADHSIESFAAVLAVGASGAPATLAIANGAASDEQRILIAGDAGTVTSDGFGRVEARTNAHIDVVLDMPAETAYAEAIRAQDTAFVEAIRTGAPDSSLAEAIATLAGADQIRALAAPS